MMGWAQPLYYGCHTLKEMAISELKTATYNYYWQMYLSHHYYSINRNRLYRHNQLLTTYMVGLVIHLTVHTDVVEV